MGPPLSYVESFFIKICKLFYVKSDFFHDFFKIFDFRRGCVSYFPKIPTIVRAPLSLKHLGMLRAIRRVMRARTPCNGFIKVPTAGLKN